MYNKLKDKLHHFQNTPQKLFWFYIGMNLIPSICLTFTEPFTFMGKFLLILLPLGFYFIPVSYTHLAVYKRQIRGIIHIMPGVASG